MSAAVAERPQGASAPAVDPRIELLSVLQLLAEPGTKTPLEFRAYREAIESHFAPWREHNAVLKAAALGAQDGGWMLLQRMLLNLSEPPALDVTGSEFAAGPLPELRPLLQDLCELSGFAAFFESQAGRHAEALAALGGGFELSEPMLDFLRVPAAPAVRFVYAPLLAASSLVARVEGEGRPPEVAVVLTHWDWIRRGSASGRMQDLQAAAWRELARAALGPSCRKAKNEVEALSALHEAVPAAARRAQWPECFEDHLARAAVVAVMRRRWGAARAVETLDTAVADGFVHTGRALAALAAYESGGERFKDITEFFPEWLKAFTEAAPASVEAARRQVFAGVSGATAPPDLGTPFGGAELLEPVRRWFDPAGRVSLRWEYEPAREVETSVSVDGEARVTVRLSQWDWVRQGSRALRERIEAGVWRAAASAALSPHCRGAAAARFEAPLARAAVLLLLRQEKGGAKAVEALETELKEAPDTARALAALLPFSDGARPLAAVLPELLQAIAAAPDPDAAALRAALLAPPGSPAPPQGRVVPALMQTADSGAGGLVSVDARIELLGLLQQLADPAPVPWSYRLLAPGAARYLEALEGRFAPLRGGPLVAELRAAGAAPGAWLSLARGLLAAGEPPGLEVRAAGELEHGVAGLLPALREFAAASGFPGFFAQHRAELEAPLSPLRAALAGEDFAATVSAYLGAPVPAVYSVVVTPTLRQAPVTAQLRRESGSEARTVLCPRDSAWGAVRTYAWPSREALVATGWHELAHLVMDDWSEPHAARLERSSGLYARIAGPARRNSWSECLAEHLIRAATQRLVASRFGAAAARRLSAADRGEGYIFVDAAADGLKRYEADRGKYPTLSDFYPEWLDQLERSWML